MTGIITAEDRYVEIPGGRLFVRSWIPHRPSRSLPLILLHDSLGCVELWRDFPENLARRLKRRVIAYDRLGYGRSSARHSLPPVSFIRDEASVVFPSLRQALGVGGYVLLGYSVGGAIALLIAGSPTEPCAAVITVSAQAFVEERTRQGIRRAAEQFTQPEQLGKLARWHGDKADWVLSAWRDVWLSREFTSWTLAHDLPNVSCPVLAIHGDRDEYGSLAFPEMIASRCGGPGEMHILAGCGHVPHRERPSEVLQVVHDWLDRVLPHTSGQHDGDDVLTPS